MPKPQEWTNVSSGPVTLASGRPLAPGEHGPSDMKHPHDQGLRDGGLLVEHETKETT
jgi:hypothetical protein